jgi:chromosome segregation ATPase
MKIKCEHCDTEWDTSGDIHGWAACAAILKERAEGWRQGVINANKISQRYEGEAREAKETAKTYKQAYEITAGDLEKARAKINDLAQDLHQARAEWFEEKKRARECEKELANLKR